MENAAHADTMVLSGLFAAIFVGGLAGWIAGKLVTGGGFGLVGNVVLGIGGAILANWVLPLIGVNLGSGFFGSILAALIGAVIVLSIIRIVKKM